MPKVSVIIPIYNVEKYIERCARSLFEQTLDDIEYIFIDDCSPDKSIKILKDVLRGYPKRLNQVQIVNMPQNSGQAMVRNAGLKHATGDYVIHCDSDDWVEHNIFEKLYFKAIESGADIVVCDFYYEKADRVETEHIEAVTPPHECLKSLKGSVMYTTWNRLVKRQLIVDSGVYFVPGINYGEDLCFMLQVYFYAQKIEYINKPLYHYNRTNEMSIVHSASNTEIIEQMMKCYDYLEAFFYRKNFPLKLTKAKINLRDRWLSIRARDNMQRWQATYPEVVSVVIKDKSLKLIYRICYALAAKGFYSPLNIYIWISSLKKHQNVLR